MSGNIAAWVTGLYAGVSRQSLLSHAGTQTPQLWRAAGKPLPPTVGGKDFPFFFSPLPCKKQTEFVKKICTIKSWKTYLWQSMETTLSLMGISVCLGHL